MWKSRHFFDWVSVAATELPLSKPAIKKNHCMKSFAQHGIGSGIGSDARSWKHHWDLQVATCTNRLEGDSHPVIKRRQGPPFEDAAKVHRTGTWPCHSRLSLRFANVWQILSPFIAIYDNPTAIYDMMICYVMLMTCLYDKFMTHFGGGFRIAFFAFAAFQDPCTTEATYLDRNGCRSHL